MIDKSFTFDQISWSQKSYLPHVYREVENLYPEVEELSIGLSFAIPHPANPNSDPKSSGKPAYL